jgi:deazaflavin-dependent oxidoreductase (nitroreductase family)
VDPNSRTARAVQKMASTKLFLAVAPHVMPYLDRWLHKLTKGRFMLSSMMLPTMTLTTTGRKSGQQRSVPLATIPLGDVLYIVGSNWGGDSDPAWALNLIADPRAHVLFEGDSFDSDATLLGGDEKAAVWPDLSRRWPIYDFYVKKSGRDLKVFRLNQLTRN